MTEMHIVMLRNKESTSLFGTRIMLETHEHQDWEKRKGLNREEPQGPDLQVLLLFSERESQWKELEQKNDM